MPHRNRRTGYRPNQTFEPTLRGALDAEVDRLEAIADPAERAREVNSLFSAFDDVLDEMSKVRLRAIQELLGERWSVRTVAEMIGLSPTRVRELRRQLRNTCLG